MEMCQVNLNVMIDHVGEPALSADFAARVMRRARAARKRRSYRRRIGAAAACAITGALFFHLIHSHPGTANFAPIAGPVAAGESNAAAFERTGWPLGWDVTGEQNVDDYFFPDLGALANFSSNYQTEAVPALDSVLGFDQGAV
jgi:hypothetical protein